jgi:GNAT superfamily N-acetyltransferase
MCDEWMPTVKLPMSLEGFRRLPRNAAYRYEYLNGQALLTPRPRHYHAVLSLRPLPVAEDVTTEPLRPDGLEALQPVFMAAFRGLQPFGSLDDTGIAEAARQSLERTRTGGDGPWIEDACFVALAEGKALGAICVTLLPDGDPCHWDSYYWREPPPPDCVARCAGRPHLTWVFVDPHLSGRGIGTALLARSVEALLRLGFRQLYSTFLLGNESSMLWHWRSGFELLAYPGSRRLLQERWKKRLG